MKAVQKSHCPSVCQHFCCDRIFWIVLYINLSFVSLYKGSWWLEKSMYRFCGHEVKGQLRPIQVWCKLSLWHNSWKVLLFSFDILQKGNCLSMIIGICLSVCMPFFHHFHCDLISWTVINIRPSYFIQTVKGSWSSNEDTNRIFGYEVLKLQPTFPLSTCMII